MDRGLQCGVGKADKIISRFQHSKKLISRYNGDKHNHIGIGHRAYYILAKHTMHGLCAHHYRRCVTEVYGYADGLGRGTAGADAEGRRLVYGQPLIYETRHGSDQQVPAELRKLLTLLSLAQHKVNLRSQVTNKPPNTPLPRGKRRSTSLDHRNTSSSRSPTGIGCSHFEYVVLIFLRRIGWKNMRRYKLVDLFFLPLQLPHCCRWVQLSAG